MKNYLLLLYCFTFLIGNNKEHIKNSPISILSKINKEKLNLKKPVFSFNKKWVENINLILPCDGVPVPKRAMRLPNAPRDYRSGIHRGIDFFANWGSLVKNVSRGVVLRADHGFKEVPPNFREDLLKKSAKVGYTPSDIFNNILLGRAVFIDHGFDLLEEYRIITIYAHLSHIEENIIPGLIIEQGELIGRSGNSGMRESTIGSKEGSHLHWEMIFQKDTNEIYLGQDMPNPDLYNMLKKLFK